MVRTKQVIIPLDEVSKFRNGSELAFYLMRQGLNVGGNIKRFVDLEGNVMVYTETLEGEDERPDTDGKVSAVEGGV